MAASKMFAALVVTALSIYGANAGPCKPLTTTTVATSTTAAPTVTTTEPPSTTATSTAAPTTTAPVCHGNQIIINPSFEDNSSGAPWSGDVSIGHGDGHTGSAETTFQSFQGNGDATISQTLYNVQPGAYQLSFAFSVKSYSPWADTSGSFGCSYSVLINNQNVAGNGVNPESPFYPNWSTNSAVWITNGADQADFKIQISCGGEYNSLVIITDDVTLTRECQAAT
ncbi:hypothetical protein BGZ63DRAFT_79792 [Mariannaea sp. PMI_226]|nr:hypothetical protein BGZ63DRAFT_79792 [Mariannaea sp. PMI_226]